LKCISAFKLHSVLKIEMYFSIQAPQCTAGFNSALCFKKDLWTALNFWIYGGKNVLLKYHIHGKIN